MKVGVVTFKEVTFTLLHLVDDLSLTHVTVSGEVAIDLLRTCDAYDLRMHAEEAGGSMAGVGPSPVLPLPAAAACFRYAAGRHVPALPLCGTRLEEHDLAALRRHRGH